MDVKISEVRLYFWFLTFSFVFSLCSISGNLIVYKRSNEHSIPNWNLLMRKREQLVKQCKLTNEDERWWCLFFVIFSRFEEETGYPKQDARFLDLSIRAICTTEENRDVDIEKDLITSKKQTIEMIRKNFLLFRSDYSKERRRQCSDTRTRF